MSFEMYPAEAVQQFNDPGSYYIREDGKLRTNTAYSGHRPKMTQGREQPAISSAKCTTSSQNTPRKLYNMALDFVAANVSLVESLVGFPEVVGQQLFDASHHHGSLDLQALRLFSDAYGDVILQRLNFKGCHLAVEQHLGCLGVFAFLSELEVGGCRLGDDHEILPVVANFHSLKRLGLGGNSLTDVGIQRVTAPLRVLGRGPKNLCSLDLAGNSGVSDKSAIQYLTAFTSLEAIDLSGCSSIGLDVLKIKLRLKMSTSNISSTSMFLHPPIETIGWASPLVEEWLQSSAALMQSAKCKAGTGQTPGAAKAASFYGRASKRLENASSLADINPRSVPSISPVIQLIARTSEQSELTSSLVDKEKTAATRVTKSSLSRYLNRKPTTYRQEVDSGAGADTDKGMFAFDKELVGQYAPDINNTFKEWSDRLQNPMDSDAKYRSADGSRLAVGKERGRIEKPPPKKRIKLCVRAPKGFADILTGAETQTMCSSEGQQDSDGGRPADENHATSQRTCKSNNRPDAPHSITGKHSDQPSCKCRLKSGVSEGTTSCKDCTCSQQANVGVAKSVLWSAMQSKDWG